jgi:hypothetical protein
MREAIALFESRLRMPDMRSEEQQRLRYCSPF